MEHKDCVHNMLDQFGQADRDNPGDPGEESQLDQLCELVVDVMRENNHGSLSKEHIEGAVLGARLIYLRSVGLLAQQEVRVEEVDLIKSLVAELGLVMSRAYRAESSSVVDLEELWNL